jgi:hypothetical protein
MPKYTIFADLVRRLRTQTTRFSKELDKMLSAPYDASFEELHGIDELRKEASQLRSSCINLAARSDIILNQVSPIIQARLYEELKTNKKIMYEAAKTVDQDPRT